MTREEMQAALTAAGLVEWRLGGNLRGMVREWGEYRVTVVDGFGDGLPEPDSWLIDLSDSDSTLAEWSDAPPRATDAQTFADCLKAACDRAATLDMEQSARRRGDLQRESGR